MTAELKTRLWGIAICLIAGAVGTVVFELIGFPAAAVTGSAFAVSLTCLFSGASMDLPVRWRDFLFVLIGLNIGSGATVETVQAAKNWPETIMLLSLCVLATLYLSRAFLNKVIKLDPIMAMLAAAPGHLSFVLGIAAERNIDAAPVALIQSIRVLAITLLVPPLITWGLAEGMPDLPELPTMSWINLIALTLAAGAVGLAFQKFNLPAAYLLAGMAVSAAGHMSGLTPGRMPWGLLTVAMIAMGALIGSRFSGVTAKDLRHALAGGVAVTSIGFAVTLISVAIAALLFDASVPLLIIAFVPGGVEAMAAIAILMGMDPAFVAAHHLSRLIILSFLMPIWARRAFR